MKKLLLIVFLLFMPSLARAQQAVVGASCPASGQSAISTQGVPVQCTQVPGGGALVWTAVGGSSSGGGGAANVGPVINCSNPIYGVGASPVLADNNSTFTACTAAAMTLAQQSSTITTSAGKFCNTASSSIVISTCNLTIAAHDSVVVFIINSTGSRTFTVTDSGGSVYVPVAPAVAAGGGIIREYASTPGNALASTSVTVTDSGAAEFTAIAVGAYANVGRYQQVNQLASGTGTAVATSALTCEETGCVIASPFGWASQTASASANVGTLRTSTSGGGASNFGAGIMDNTGTAGNTVTTSATLSTSEAWGILPIELIPGPVAFPTVYVPPNGVYYYSGGLALTIPSALQCGQNAILYYTGSAHAVDLGSPTNVRFGGTNYQPFTVEDCRFEGAQNATEGIYLNPFILYPNIRNNYFLDFGNSGATYYQIYCTHDCQDFFVFGNRSQVTDGIPRKFLITNGDGTGDNNSFARIQSNQVWCYVGVGPLCTAAQSFVGFSLSGAQNRVSNNNLAGLNPAVLFKCAVSACNANQVDENILELASDGLGTCAIQFANTQNGMTVTKNGLNAHGNATASLVCPNSGTDLLEGSNINFNRTWNIPNATPLVALNNLAGQAGNQSFDNNCSTSGTGSLAPCITPHTTGSNITSWSNSSDDGLTATGQAPALTGTGACATGNLSAQTGSWTGTVACGGTTGASTLIITPGSTAAHSFVCSGADVTSGHLLTAQQLGTSTTSCTLSLTSVTLGDTVSFMVITQ